MVLYIIIAIVAIVILSIIVCYRIKIKSMKKALEHEVAAQGGMSVLYESLVKHMRMSYGCFKVEEKGLKLFISNAPIDKSRVMYAQQTLILNQTETTLVVTFTSVTEHISKTWVEPMPIDQERVWDKIRFLS